MRWDDRPEEDEDEDDEELFQEPEGGWSPWRVLAFWIGAVYAVFYTFPFPVSSLPYWRLWKDRLGLDEPPAWLVSAGETWDEGLSWVLVGTSDLWTAIATWTGTNVFDVEVIRQATGSGDTRLAYVRAFVQVLLALVLGLVLSLASRRRTPWRWVRFTVWVGLRYYLAFQMLSYGFYKIIPTQFSPPDLQRLLTPIGDASPMGLVWTFMGASEPYNWFTGSGEVLGGLLLLFRRTTTLGALVTFAVMVNVLALNLFYDVPVKLFSAHLVGMAILLAALDGRRLLALFLTNRATAPRDLRAPHTGRVLAVTAWAAKLLLVTVVVWGDVDASWSVHSAREARERTTLYGIWEVERFVSDGEELPPLLEDSIRWRRWILERVAPGGTPRVTLERMDGTQRTYRLSERRIGRDAQDAEVERPADVPPWDETWDEPRSYRMIAARVPARDGRAEVPRSSARLELVRSEPERLVLSGEFDGAELEVTLRRRLPEDFELTGRGFHWVNEIPYSR